MNSHESRTIWWDGHRGRITVHPVLDELSLRKPPIINGAPVVQIDYAPLIGRHDILEAGHAWRRMTAAECKDIDERLKATVAAGLAVWE